MAKINPTRIKQDADKEERAGRPEKAIELLRQLEAENPRDWNTINKIGDLYTKLNPPNLKAANEKYAKVAALYTNDGFYLKAIAVWKKVLKNDPSELAAKISLGDLQAKQGLATEAKQTYNEVFDEYVKRNRIRDAGEVLQRMAQVDPADLKVRIRLAELYVREGRQEKAAAEYVAIADELVKKSHLAEALQLLEKGLKMGQRSPRLLSEAARVHLVQKDYAKAIGYLQEARRGAPDDRDVALRLAEGYLGAKRPAEARAVLEEMLARDAGDQDARLQLGRVDLAEGLYDEAFEHFLPAVDKLIERRQADRAAAVLQLIVQKKPSHVRSLAKLVELYRQSRNDQLVAQTYSQMVEAYLADRQLDQAASILEMLVQLEPSNGQHQTKLAWVRSQVGQAAQPPVGEGFQDDFVEAPAPLPAGAQRPAAARPAPTRPAPTSPARRARIELSGPLSPEDREFIDEHLAEGRVFRKYGLGDKARDQFEAVLGRFPDNVDARQELRDQYKDKGDDASAREQMRAIADILRLRGDEAEAARAEKELAALEGPPAPAPTPGPSVPVAAPADLGVEVALEEPSRLEDELGLVEVEEAAASAPEAEPAFDEGDLGGGEIRGQFLEEEPQPPAEAAETAFDLEVEETPSPRPAPAPPLGLVPQARAEPARAGVPPELQRMLEEVESYVSLGFVEDAKDHLAEVETRFAGHPALASKLAELGLSAVSPDEEIAFPEPPAAGPVQGGGIEEPLQLGADFLDFTPPPAPPPRRDLADLVSPPPSASPPAAGGGAFDLATELGDLFGAQPAVAAESSLGTTDLGDPSLADIFREFQKGVEKQLGKEDYETRYNLGIAYKEMGLVDEAIAEFQLAAKDETRLLECASMLGICFVEKGMPKLAVKWFEKGLSAPGRSEEEYKGLRYDLADALEQAGELDEALALFTEVYGQDAKFRDDQPEQAVGARIERLRGRVRLGAGR